MMHTIPSTTPSGRLPDGSLALIQSLRRLRGLLFADGRIAALGKPLLDELGFGRDANLNGLAFQSFWHHSQRDVVSAALKEAAEEGAAEVDLDLSYIKGRSGPCNVRLEKAPLGGMFVVTLRCHD